MARETQYKQNSRKEKAILIGYGGASKAILYSLLKTGFKKIRVFNRDFSKIKDLKNISASQIRRNRKLF